MKEGLIAATGTFTELVAMGVSFEGQNRDLSAWPPAAGTPSTPKTPACGLNPHSPAHSGEEAGLEDVGKVAHVAARLVKDEERAVGKVAKGV